MSERRRYTYAESRMKPPFWIVMDRRRRMAEAWDENDAALLVAALNHFAAWHPIATAPLQPFGSVPSYWMFRALVWPVYGDVRALVWPVYGEVREAIFSYSATGKGRWKTSSGHMCVPQKWMPLPSPPQGEAGMDN